MLTIQSRARSILQVATCAIALALTTASCTSAPKAVSNKDKLVSEALTASAVLEPFSLPENLLEEMVESFPEKARVKAKVTVVEAANRADFTGHVSSELLSMSETDLAQVRDFYLSATGRAFLNSVKAATLASRSQFVIRHKDSDGETPGKASLRARYLANTTVSERQRLEEIFLYWAVLHAGNTVRPEAERIKDPMVSKVAEIMYGKDEAERRAEVLEIAELQSETLSEMQWQAVVQFNETPAARAFYAKVNAGITRALGLR